MLLPLLAVVWLALSTTCCKVSVDWPDPPDPTVKVNVWDTLPAITQEGKYTIGCLVNGKVWVPHGVNLMGGIKSMYFDEKKNLGSGRGDFSINYDSIDDNMSISFGPTHFNPNYYKITSDKTDPQGFSVQFISGTKFYYPDTSVINNSNFVEITKVDTLKNFVSGKFSFTLYQGNFYKVTDHNDSIVITDGRFDMLYYPQ
jgi:hypothetical protein